MSSKNVRDEPIFVNELDTGGNVDSTILLNRQTIEYIFPNVNATITGNDISQTLTNKNITGNTNQIDASGLQTTGDSVIISTSSPPIPGETLVATSSTTAEWQFIQPSTETIDANLVIANIACVNDELQVDSITEKTLDSGVFVDGVNLIDGNVIAEDACLNGQLLVDTVCSKTLGEPILFRNDIFVDGNIYANATLEVNANIINETINTIVTNNVIVDTINEPITISPLSSTRHTLDQFERIRIANPFTLLSLKQTENALPLFYDQSQTSGSGTSTTFNANAASSTISVSATTAGTRVMQSKLRGIYEPGKALEIFITGTIGSGGTGITKRWGYFDNENGLFFEQDDGLLYLVKRTYTSGTAVDTRISQSNWNIDKMDGTGPSGITLDVTQANIYIITFEWLGVGQVSYQVNIDGFTYEMHRLRNANNMTGVYMSNPNLPIRYEISNDGTGGASSLETICGTIISSGGQNFSTRSIYMSRGGSATTMPSEDTFYPVISLRLRSGYESRRVDVVDVQVLVTSSTEFYEWQLILNPTIAGTDAASWVAADTSASVEYDISRTTTNVVSGGIRLAGGYGSGDSRGSVAATSTVNSFLTLGSAIDGTRDEIVLAIQNVGGTGGDVYGGITVSERT